MAPSRPQGSRLSRAFSSFLIFPFISLLSLYYMDPVAMFSVSNTTQDGFFRWGSVEEPVIKRFHLVGFMDTVLRDATTGFAPSTYAVDPLSWWQCMMFLTDVAPIYMVWLMESSRPLHRGSIVQFPSIMSTAAQLLTGAVCFPLQYLLHLVYRPPSTAKSLDDLRIDLGDVILYLPLSILLNTVPVLGMFFAPDLASRQYFVWFWQLYPVRIGLKYYAIIVLVKLIGSSTYGLKLNYQTTLRTLFAPIIILQVSIWLYTVFNAPFPLRTVFFPGKVEPEFAGNFIGIMRRVLQVDYCGVAMSSFLWLFYLFWDMSISGLVSRQQLYFYPLLLGWFPLFGPGATFAIMWLWKEQFIVPQEAHNKKK